MNKVNILTFHRCLNSPITALSPINFSHEFSSVYTALLPVSPGALLCPPKVNPWHRGRPSGAFPIYVGMDLPLVITTFQSTSAKTSAKLRWKIKQGGQSWSIHGVSSAALIHWYRSISHLRWDVITDTRSTHPHCDGRTQRVDLPVVYIMAVYGRCRTSFDSQRSRLCLPHPMFSNTKFSDVAARRKLIITFYLFIYLSSMFHVISAVI